MSNRDATRRKPGEVDWDAAEAFYLELDPPRRLQRVVEQFSVSRVSVGKQAKARKWRDKAAELDAKVAANIGRRAVRTRAERVQKVLGIVDAALDGFDANLDAKIAEAKLSDLPALQKLAELLEGHATDRVDIRKVQPVIVMFVGRIATTVRLPDLEQREAALAVDLDWLEGELLAIEAPTEGGS